MSIINDAIKKARKEFEINAVQKDPSSFLPPTVHKQRLLSDKRWAIAISVCLVIIASLLGSVAIYKNLTSVSIDLNSRENTSLETTQNVFSPQDLQKKKNVSRLRPSRKTRDSRFELNGIVYEPEDRWAIINNKIVREGDPVPRGKLLLIGKDFVEVLSVKGEKLTFKLQ